MQNYALGLLLANIFVFAKTSYRYFLRTSGALILCIYFVLPVPCLSLQVEDINTPYIDNILATLYPFVCIHSEMSNDALTNYFVLL